MRDIIDWQAFGEDHVYDVKFKQESASSKYFAQKTSTDRTEGKVPQAGFYGSNTMKSTLKSDALLKNYFTSSDSYLSSFKNGRLSFQGEQFLQVHTGLPEEFLFAKSGIDFEINNEYWESWVDPSPDVYYGDDGTNLTWLWVILSLIGICCCICCCCGAV